MMGLTSVAVSFWGKTIVASTPLFWGGEDEECRVGRFATAKHLK
jgi:hypothetical protein